MYLDQWHGWELCANWNEDPPPGIVLELFMELT